MQLLFYYDVVCPFAYIASTRVQELAQHTNAELIYKPVLLGGIFRGIGNDDDPNKTMSPAKARHNTLDMQRWADYFNVRLKRPDNHPRRTVLAMRTILAAEDSLISATDALFKCYWGQGLDVSDPKVVESALTDAGLDGDRLVQAAGTQPIKDELRTRTDEAIARGLFGVPSFVVGDQLFWGQDRLHFVEQALKSAA